MKNKNNLNDNRSGIYKIFHIESGKVYIGSAKNLRVRKNSHHSTLNKNKHENSYLQNAWNKYGVSAFEFHIIEYCDLNDLNSREQYYIFLYNACDRNYGYNLRIIAGSNRGIKWSKESRDKLSKTVTGKKVSDETKNLLLSYASQPKSEEIKAKISKTLKGRKYSAERCANMSKGKSEKRKFILTEPPINVETFAEKDYIVDSTI